MQIKNVATTLTTLNDDCLLLICEQLAIRDQFALLQLSGHLKSLILHIWQRKYATGFDCSEQRQQLKLLNADELGELLTHIGSLTRGLLNLSSADCQALERRCMPQLPNMSRISVRPTTDAPALQTTLFVSQLPRICMNLTELSLGAGALVLPTQLQLLLLQLQQLSVFEWLPGNCHCSHADCWRDIKYGSALQTLKLPACAVRLSSRQLTKLPQLQHLIVYCCLASDNMRQVFEKTTEAAAATPTATTAALLAAINSSSSSSSCQIVALHLQCQFQCQLPQLLLAKRQLFQLRQFSWHAQLTVHYDATNGYVKWLPQQPHVARAVLKFIVTQTKSLHQLDFTSNIHVTPTFIEQLQKQLQQHNEISICHDGLATTTTTIKSGNNLSYMHFELEHF